MQGVISMSNNKISGLATPTLSDDAATKEYVDGIAFSGIPLATTSTTLSTPTGVATSGTMELFPFLICDTVSRLSGEPDTPGREPSRTLTVVGESTSHLERTHQSTASPSGVEYRIVDNLAQKI